MSQLIAWLFGLGLSMNAALFVPQIIKILRTRSSSGVSLLSFFGFNLVQLVGALHGYFQQDRPLLIGMLASLITCGSVTALAVRSR